MTVRRTNLNRPKQLLTRKILKESAGNARGALLKRKRVE